MAYAMRYRRSTRRRTMNSRSGRGRYRGRNYPKGRTVRLVVQAPRGILPVQYKPGTWRRYRRRRYA